MTLTTSTIRLRESTMHVVIWWWGWVSMIIAPPFIGVRDWHGTWHHDLGMPMICLCPIICDVPINLMFLLVKSCGTYHVRVYLHDMSHVATYCSRYICGQVMSQRFKGRVLGVLDLHCQSATLYSVEMEAGPIGCHRWRHSTMYHHLLQTLVHIIRGGFSWTLPANWFYQRWDQPNWEASTCDRGNPLF